MTQASPAAGAARPALSIVIPAYNEEHGLPLVLAQLQTVLEASPFPYEIIVVDDGSVDGTAAVARSFASVTVLQHGHNRGYGAAIKTAIRQANYGLITHFPNLHRIWIRGDK